MLRIKAFTFNPYQENTYVISTEKGHCAIIDPGCYSASEQARLSDYIDSEGLQPIYLLNTHGHIDHMLGNSFVKEKYDIPFLTHRKVVPELEANLAIGAMFGLSPSPSPPPDRFLEEGDEVKLGEEVLEIFFTPGHSAGHISFFHRASGSLFSGDVLFRQSIGRTDLPGGDYPTLMDSIFKKVLPLGDEVRVYSGHGPETTIGEEKRSNPFILQESRNR